MTVTQEKIVNVVNANNGSASWKNIMDGLDYRERQRALGEIRALEATGTIRRVVAVNPDTNQPELTIRLGGE
jgi:SOS-response transcriptional repressor LexA